MISLGLYGAYGPPQASHISIHLYNPTNPDTPQSFLPMDPFILLSPVLQRCKAQCSLRCRIICVMVPIPSSDAHITSPSCPIRHANLSSNAHHTTKIMHRDRTCWGPNEPLPWFSYHAIFESQVEADMRSKSPSPSRSAAYTDHAPLA